MYHNIPFLNNLGLLPFFFFFVRVHILILTIFGSNVSFRHDLIVCLSKAVRDAVIQEKEHYISDKCRKQLRVEKKEEASQSCLFGGSSSLGICYSGKMGEWLLHWTRAMNIIVEKTLFPIKPIVEIFWVCCCLMPWQYGVHGLIKSLNYHERLVFTSDGVVVGVVIRRVERYDLVKIKSTESEAEHWFCLCLHRLRSSANCIVGVASRSGRINQWQCSIPGFAIGWFFRFCFRLWQPSFHWIISGGVVNGVGRNGNVLILPTPIPSSLWLCLRLRFSIFTRS